MGVWNILIFIQMLALAIVHMQSHESIPLTVFPGYAPGWRILNKAIVHSTQQCLFVHLFLFHKVTYLFGFWFDERNLNILSFCLAFKVISLSEIWPAKCD